MTDEEIVSIIENSLLNKESITSLECNGMGWDGSQQ